MTQIRTAIQAGVVDPLTTGEAPTTTISIRAASTVSLEGSSTRTELETYTLE